MWLLFVLETGMFDSFGVTFFVFPLRRDAALRLYRLEQRSDVIFNDEKDAS